MDRRKISLCLACVVLTIAAIGTRSWARSTQTVKKASVQWHHDLKAAHKVSVATGRPLLILFGASWCIHCREFERETLSDPTLVRYVNAQFVPVHLDLDKDKRVAQILDVKSVPTSVILSPEADLMGSAVGALGKSECQKFLRAAVNTERSSRTNDGK